MCIRTTKREKNINQIKSKQLQKNEQENKMGSLASESRTLQVRLTRKIVCDFVQHDILPDSSGAKQPMDASSRKKSVHDSQIRGEF